MEQQVVLQNTHKMVADASNLILNDLKNLSTMLKSISKALYEKNNILTNQLLVINDDGLRQFVNEALFHLFIVSQQKNLSINHILNLLAKFVTLANLFVEKGFVSNKPTPNSLQKQHSQVSQNLSKDTTIQKNQQSHKKHSQQQSLNITLARIVDILTFLINRKEVPQIELRIIQTAFSLINRSLMRFMDYGLIIKVYSICFNCCLCQNSPIVQNISVSALSAFTETLFGNGFGSRLPIRYRSQSENQLKLLQNFLKYLLGNEKFSWVNDSGLKGVMWDLVIIAVRNLTIQLITQINQNQLRYQSLIDLLQAMYKLSADNSFSKSKPAQQKLVKTIERSVFDKSNSSIIIDENNTNTASQKNSVSLNFRKGGLSDFVRFYKAFVYFSISLWMRPTEYETKPLVFFPSYLSQQTFLKALENQKEKNIKSFLYLEGVSLLLTAKNDLALIEEKGYLLVQILAKTSQQICLLMSNSNQQIDVKWWDNHQTFLDKTCGEFTIVNDGDFIRLIRSTLITLRTKFQKDQEQFQGNKLEETSQFRVLTQETSIIENQQSSQLLNEKVIVKGFKSSPKLLSKNSKTNSHHEKQEKILKIRWERLIRNIIRTIRYLSSLNYKQTGQSSLNNMSHSIYGPGNEQQPSRKVLIQLQHWFLLCPTFKTRNLILQELLTTSASLQTKIQSIKSSQCVQIGTSLIYGYYSKIDSTGISILLKMIAGVRVDFQQTKGFEQLQEVASVAQNLFQQGTQNVITNENIFSKTIQAFVQCVSSLLAQIMDNPQESLTSNGAPSQKELLKKNHRSLKIIDFLIEKFTIVIRRYGLFITEKDWYFITAFFITLCSNRNQSIQLKGIKELGEIVKHFLKEDACQEDVEGYQKTEDPQNPINEQQIMNICLELIKCPISVVVHRQILVQLKDHLMIIKSQEALMKGFQIVNILYASEKVNRTIMTEIQEIQEILIKDCLFRIVRLDYLSSIIDDFGHLSTDKNLQYNLITLLWSIADHFKKLYPRIQNHQESNQFEEYLRLWKRLFDRLLKLSFKNKQPEFRQSALHVVTQIIAQNFGILGRDLVLRIMNENYLSMLCMLLDIPRSSTDNQVRVDMAKFGIKNYIKILKKMIIEKIFLTESDCIADRVNQRICQLLASNDEKPQNNPNKRQGTLTVEYLQEICLMIEQLFQQPIGFQFIGKEQLAFMVQQIGQRMKLLDQNTLHFKRKLAPLYQELKIKLEPVQYAQRIKQDVLKNHKEVTSQSKVLEA